MDARFRSTSLDVRASVILMGGLGLLAEAAASGGRRPLQETIATGFEEVAVGPLTAARFAGATWRAKAGAAAILDELACTGERCLHLRGGDDAMLEVAFADGRAAVGPAVLRFAA